MSGEEKETGFNTLANKITALRIAFVPLVVVCLFEDSPRAGFFGALLFGIAGITDYFDGYYARTRKAITVLGKLLDPLADKFLVVSSLIMLMHLDRIHPAIVILLVCREIAITGLRAIASAEGIVIGASNLAKWKTATQMAAIPMLMLHETYFFIPFQTVGTVCIGLSLLISIWSAKDYIVDFFRTLQSQAREKREEKRLKKAAKRAARLKRMIDKNPDLAKLIRDATAPGVGQSEQSASSTGADVTGSVAAQTKKE
ncbi:MAG: CDP-diacylglycerol--glycerol-3-phosphate 3-phosphatidyltransferase [Bdellovibrionota bacterium]